MGATTWKNLHTFCTPPSRTAIALLELIRVQGGLAGRSEVAATDAHGSWFISDVLRGHEVRVMHHCQLIMLLVQLHSRFGFLFTAKLYCQAIGHYTAPPNDYAFPMCVCYMYFLKHCWLHIPSWPLEIPGHIDGSLDTPVENPTATLFPTQNTCILQQ